MRIPPPFVYFFGFILVFVPAIIIHTTTKDHEGVSDLAEYNGAPTFISFIIVVILLTMYSRFRYRHSRRTWNSGVFHEKTPFTSDTLLQAYIRLGALMLRQDTVDLKGKLKYLLNYFGQHFENSYTPDLSEYVTLAFRNPINLKNVMPWLKLNLYSNSQRSQLVYFLAGLSAVDGSINPLEKRFLQDVAFQLDITQKDFDSIMAMYTKYEDAFHRQQHQQRQGRTTSKSRSQYKREKAAKVLGVSECASIDEIKKAYRSLAKVHHPDKFAGESEYQQKIAEERFIQIQQAYELLTDFKN